MVNDPILSSEVWNCENAFEVECPMKWANLTPTDTNGVRGCDSCDQLVHLCHTASEFVERGNAGQCVAIPEVIVPGRPPRGLLGRPYGATLKKIRKQTEARKSWWREVNESDPEFNVRENRIVRTYLRISPNVV